MGVFDTEGAVVSIISRSFQYIYVTGACSVPKRVINWTERYG